MKNIILLFLTINLTAQTISSDLFHEGVAITIKGDTLRGSIKYNIPLDVIFLLTEGRVICYSSVNIFFFEIFDGSLRNYRQFFSLPIEVTWGYSVRKFFELMYEDKVSLLARERVIARRDYTGFIRRGVGYNFYFISKGDKRVTPLNNSKSKRQLFRILHVNRKYMRKFVRKSKLKTWWAGHLIIITAMYNGQLRT